MSLLELHCEEEIQKALREQYPLFCETAKTHVPPRHHLSNTHLNSNSFIASSNVGISGRHVHLSDDDYNYLFDGESWHPKMALSQPGQFVDEKGVWLKHDDLYITDPKTNKPKYVALLGPGRGESQIEILPEDFPHLHISPNVAHYVSDYELKIGDRRININKYVPYRMSGDLKKTPEMTVVNPTNKKEITVAYGTILAPPHAHMSIDEAKYFGVVDNEEVYGVVCLNREPIHFTHRLPVRVSDRFALDVHVELNSLTRKYIGASREGKLTIDLYKL